jgi:hypothetical protein
MFNFIIKKNLMNDFAELLKTSRENWKPKKISLKKLAEAIDNICSDAYLSQLENRRYEGKKGNPMRPDKEIVIALSKFFNWDLNEALKLAGHPSEEKVLPAPLSVSDFDGFDKDDLKEISEYIKFKKLLKAQNNAKP